MDSELTRAGAAVGQDAADRVTVSAAWAAVVYITLILIVGVLALVLYITADFVRRRRSTSFPLADQFKTYVVLKIMDIISYYFCWRFHRDTKMFMKVQRQLLRRILRINGRTRYGVDFRFSEMISMEDFRQRHPITDYAHYAPYIAAVERGEESALLGGDEVLIFAVSSGTTGKLKHVPVGRREFRRVVTKICASFYACMERQVGEGAVGRVLRVKSATKVDTSESGKSICSLSLLYHKNALSRLRSAAPPCLEQIHTEGDACYVNLLFALIDDQLHALFCNFIHHFLSMMRVLEHHWTSMLEDISSGTLGKHLSLPANVRDEINGQLQASPQRAKILRDQFLRGFTSIVPRIWPQLKFVQAARSGDANRIYVERCRRYLGNVPVLDLTYACSEGVIGQSMSPAEPVPTFTLVADSVVYEFVPAHRAAGRRTEEIEPRHLLLADQLAVGQEYELVLTTGSGLYRYRLGDVVRVTGFHNQAPTVEFAYRAGQMLNVRIEKLSEQVFYRSLEMAVQSWPVDSVLQDFTTAESVLVEEADAGGPPHYLIFLEMDGRPLSTQETDMIDTCLQRSLEAYEKLRCSGAIGAPQVHQVSPGSFQRLRQLRAAESLAHWSQLKVPRVLRQKQHVQTLLQHTIPPRRAGSARKQHAQEDGSFVTHF